MDPYNLPGGGGGKYTVKTDLFYILIIDKKSNKGNFLQICIIAQMIMQTEEYTLEDPNLLPTLYEFEYTYAF